ncbi:hypothetical protein F2Q69_00058498 [Brassica cretica]|uniref:Uncharacterized protein n=1 Tax=Brassica cretica TaxID=69181 RepID=A0A8S9RDG2_BRACR|nr:hypothetical protein F2Q69_00058498 [Brassica cretica]
MFGRGKRIGVVWAVRKTGSGPFKWYQSDYGSRTRVRRKNQKYLHRVDAKNAKGEHWRTDQRLDLGSDQVGLTLCMGKFKLSWRMIGLLKLTWRMNGLLEVFWITQESYPRNYSQSMDPDSEVKKWEGLAERFLKLKEDNLKESGNRETEMDKSSMEKSIMTKTLMMECEVERLTFKWNVLLRMLRRILRFSSDGQAGLYGPRVEIIETRDWKSGVLAKDLLGEQETTRRNRVGLMRHNCSGTVCSGVYGNREFPRRDFCGNPILCLWEMYLPRHNCTVTGTQGVHYCGFPIAVKAWMGTSESLPSHVCRTSVCLICHVCTDVFGNC